ncbi:MAG TPA: RecQ family ATP-dependent DNA helicase [Anaerolineales bacterium]|nr:RecQ family ATP-dependent DNA helicase [Anaerolineales bacterium]
MPTDLETRLQSQFGYQSFRPGQVEAIQSLLGGQHTLVVMPTGAGKSLVFQFVAMQLPGLTLVISPLISLMKDQVDSLNRRRISATFVNSSLPLSEQKLRLQHLAAGKYRLVYIAPERLRSWPFIEALQSQPVSLLAVDEAHCISEWGHDFRPDYLHLAQARSALGHPLTVALTATATPQVQSDVLRLLNIPQAQRIVTGFNRPNLFFEVRYTPDPTAKFQVLSKLLTSCPHEGSIVYVGARRDAEIVASFVQQVLKIRAEHYHAGLPPEERAHLQEAFMQGRLPVIAATNAFGMGIDRADVRQVIHYDLPGSIEAYYQEAGRAGRDGLPAKAVLLYAAQDRALQEWFIANSATTATELQRLHAALEQNRLEEIWTTSEELSRATGLPDVKIRLGLSQLERAGSVEHLGDEGLRQLLRRRPWNAAAIREAIARGAEHQRHRTAQLDRMIAYAETNTCRRRILLDYFGDSGQTEAPHCCDNCFATPASTVYLQTNLAQLTQSARVAIGLLDAAHRLGIKVGRKKLAQILKGSQAKDILQFHHNRSPYYGRLAVYSLDEIEDLIDQLVWQGYFKIVGGEYPVLKLTPHGEAALRARSEILLKLPRPIDAGAVARKKAERAAGGTLEFTAQLFEEGLSPAEIAVRRSLTVATVYNHLAQLIAGGKISVEAVIPADIRSKVEAAIIKAENIKYLANIKVLLPEEIDYEVILCVVEAWKLRQNRIINQSGALNPEEEITKAILACVEELPGRFPRSGVAKLLVGSKSVRVENYINHPIYNRLAGLSRSKVMTQIDKLLTSGQLAKDYHGKIVLGVKKSPLSNESIKNFLSRPQPRRLEGPWSSGWAIDFHSGFSGAQWSRSPAGTLAYRLKYQGDLDALPSLVQQARELIRGHPELVQVDVILAVPPSTARPADPVATFAAALGEQLGRKVLPALVKTRQTAPQKEMHTLAQKQANVAGAFALRQPVAGLRLLVVDDLFDSGATLEEITRLLIKSGAAQVFVLTLTRTIHADA